MTNFKNVSRRFFLGTLCSLAVGSSALSNETLSNLSKKDPSELAQLAVTHRLGNCYAVYSESTGQNSVFGVYSEGRLYTYRLYNMNVVNSSDGYSGEFSSGSLRTAQKRLANVLIPMLRSTACDVTAPETDLPASTGFDHQSALMLSDLELIRAAAGNQLGQCSARSTREYCFHITAPGFSKDLVIYSKALPEVNQVHELAEILRDLIKSERCD